MIRFEGFKGLVLQSRAVPPQSVNNCNLGDAELKFDPTPFNFIVGVSEFATNLYHTSAEEFGPQLLIFGEDFVALSKVPLVLVQPPELVNRIAAEQRSFAGCAQD